ncbi:MAG: hypothetical protein VYA55_13025 [Pseudomonadota bacterium]|nr:hypothetical protein [Pseudomonadota bacterium]
MTVNQMSDAERLKHVINMLERIAMFADFAVGMCDEAQSNLDPESLQEAGASAFAAATMARQIGFIADTTVKSLNGFPVQSMPENWITPGLAFNVESKHEGTQ